MKKYDTILFDLDGTLTDSLEGIVNSFTYALGQFDITVPRTELFKCVGPPLWESFGNFFGFSGERLERVLEEYQVYYKDRGIFENTVYDGVPGLLKKLHEAGYRLVVASSKKEIHVHTVVRHFGLDKYFDFIAGSDTSAKRYDKDDVIEHVLKSLSISDVSGTIMVGDREHDIFGARTWGLDSIGILYGYGDRGEMENAKATYILDTVKDLEEFFGV